MPTYIAFLRAVNVGTRQVKMADLRTFLSDNGFDDVETHIQTGNLKVRSALRSDAKVETRLRELLSEEYGFDIPVIARTAKQLQDLLGTIDKAGSPLSAQAKAYVGFGRGRLDAQGVQALEAWEEKDERVVVYGSDIVLWLDKGFNQTRLTNARAEKLVGTETTFRGVPVVRAMVEKWAP